MYYHTARHSSLALARLLENCSTSIVEHFFNLFIQTVKEFPKNQLERVLKKVDKDAGNSYQILNIGIDGSFAVFPYIILKTAYL